MVKVFTFFCTVFFVTSVFGENSKPTSQLIFPTHKAVGELSQSEKEQYFKAIEEKLPQKTKSKKVTKSLGNEDQYFKKTGVKPPDKTIGMTSAFWQNETEAYRHTECQIGYLPLVITPNSNLRDVQPAQSIQSDITLSRINVRLDKLRVYDYPGGGNHEIMFTFQADNSIPQQASQKETLTFSQVYEAQEGEGAGVVGYPIFIGLNVGKQGAAFKAATINVKNDRDEEALSVLKSKEFQGGLTLLTTAQPALAPFSALGTGIAEMVLSRNENKKVHECYLGLDFDSGAAYGVRLAAGNYIVVQAPDSEFQWEDWAYDPVNARIVKKSHHKDVVPYNYVIFRVTKHTD